MPMRLTDYILKSYKKRNFFNFVMHLLLGIATAVALIPLFSVFGYVITKGFSSINLAFFTELPKPVGEVGGGVANALLGSVILVSISALLAVPWGIAIGIYLSEFGKSKTAATVRFCVDMLASVPSIIIGLFVYTAIVMPMKRFSAIAGGIALAILMIPTMTKTTEEILKLVPQNLREAGLALGIPRWKVIIKVVFQGSLGAITTGIMLAIARATGETAPMLFTAFGNSYWAKRLDQPIASLPVQIYTYAISPYDDWHNKAWAAALVLVLFVFSLNLITRLVLSRSFQRGYVK